eukprot:COSAG06_NODE_3826_length_4863_cov_8.304156_2_plen_70_part_00
MVARTEISVLLSAPFPLCLASLDRLSKLSTAAREQARAGPGMVAAALRPAGSVSSLWLMPVWSGKDCCR